MMHLLDVNGGSYYDALRMYNGGTSDSQGSNLYAQKVLNSAGKDWAYVQGDPTGGAAPGGGAGSGSMPVVILVGVGLLAILALTN
jgi:hypothetical protein